MTAIYEMTVICYDPLKRLIEANYSNGDYYHYTYDATGNRKTQTTFIGGVTSTITYNYDRANRLTSVNGVTYVWDNNGNLKKDGVNAYEYDSANRLVKTCQDTSSNGICDPGEIVLASYFYNGMNDRLRETVNGVTTTFSMDLNAGLTQALSDGTKAYIYGNGRIAQAEDSVTEYFLGDALGSVRQLTNASGAITYAKAYDPYGVVTSTAGSAQSAYGYTGEYTSNNLVYLRARHYAPGIGRFLTRDTWSGDYNSPLTLNAWNYTSSNPINFTDPSGHCLNPDRSITWWKWPWFSWGDCPTVASGPNITLTPTLLTIIATATACATPAPSATNMPTGTPTPTPYIEPWKRYKDYDPASNSIPWSKWGGLDSNQWDIDRAELVWNWLGEAGKRPDVQTLTAWLLWHESGALFSEIPKNDVYHDGGGQDGAKYMIRYMKGLFSNGIDKGDLGKFTAFFNPSRNGIFDQSAWDELTKRPDDKPYFNTVRDFWHLEPIYQEITWWVPGELGFEQYASKKFLTVKYPATGADVMYFAYK